MAARWRHSTDLASSKAPVRPAVGARLPARQRVRDAPSVPRPSEPLALLVPVLLAAQYVCYGIGFLEGLAAPNPVPQELP
ncbi:MAG: hypothetical protein U5K28_05265 [Halobacteriales archaeon]|nr:hypothetical protein [Halobacteriales archaeon]